jgi:hypothetical protein
LIILIKFRSCNITFVDPNGGKHVYRVADNETILGIARAKGLEIEGMLSTIA